MSSPSLERLKTIGAAIGVISVVMGIAAALVGLVFDFRPDWRPEGPAQSRGGIIIGVAAEDVGISGKEFEEITDRPCEEYPAEDQERCRELRRINGNIVSVEVELAGSTGDRPSFVWHMYDANTGKRLDSPRVVDQPVFRDVSLEARQDRYNERFFVPCYGEENPVFIKVEAYDEAGIRLDFANSAPFSDNC